MHRVVIMLLLSLAGPAAAQWRTSSTGPAAPRPALPGSRGTTPETWRETRDIRDRITDGRKAGQLAPRTARGLRRETRAIDAAADRYGVGGVSAAEQRELDNRAAALRGQVDAARLRGKSQ